MSFSEDFLNNDGESVYDEAELKEKIIICKEHIQNGTTISSLDFLEETIEMCVDYDYVDDGLLLVNEVLNIAPYNSEAWHFKGILLNNSFVFEEAYHCFEKALSLNPNDVETYINKSIAEDILECLKKLYNLCKRRLVLNLPTKKF